MNDQSVAKKELTQSERFMNKVISEYGSGVGEVALTNHQKRLAQNYFIAIDSSLRSAEEKRLNKKKGQDPVPVVWANVNMEKLARDVVAMARVGYDPAQPNHINMMPFKNNALKKYDIVFIEGYRGMELKATKYGLEVPDRVIVELVCSNDKFKSVKKSLSNPIESYEFEIVNDFDRGEIIGGFYYHMFEKSPEKNKLVVMNLKEIEKRRPAHAAPEFWGGEKDEWKNGEKTGNKIKVEGWYEQMVYKTIVRAAHRDITIDSQKIDDDFLRLRQMESAFDEAEVSQEIRTNANGEIIDIESEPVEGGGDPEPEDTVPQAEDDPPANPSPQMSDKAAKSKTEKGGAPAADSKTQQEMEFDKQSGISEEGPNF